MTVDVLFDARHIRASGIGIYSREQIKHLSSWGRKQGARVAVLGSPEELGETDPNLEIVSAAPGKAPMYSLREQWLLTQVHRKVRPRSFWTPHYPYPALSKTANAFVTIHDVLHALPPSCGGAGGARGVYARRMIRTSLRRSRGVFVPSETTKNEVTKLFGTTNNLHVAPMRIDSAWLLEDESIQGLPTLSNDYLLFVGNVKKHKNLTGLLDAFAEIQHKTHADLVLAGGAADVKNEDAEVFKRLLKLESRVHLMGNLSFKELRRTVVGASCLIMPSFYEGVGLPPLEAMAVGTPVLASNIASLRETCGDAAYYFEPADIASIAESLLEVLQNPELRGSLSAKGRLHVRAREASIDPLLPFKIISERCL